MADHEIKQKYWLSLWNFFNLWYIQEVKTDDLDKAANFINNTWLTNSIAKIKSLLFGPKIEQNTLKILANAEEKIQKVEEQTWRHELPLKLAVSIIENGWLEDNENIQIRWSNMLANAITSQAIVQNHYPEILKQLSESEVFFLDNLFNTCETLGANIKTQWVKKMALITNLWITENEFEEIVDNLLRLNLIHTWEWNDLDSKDDSYISLHMKRWIICLTCLGKSFINACKFK